MKRVHSLVLAGISIILACVSCAATPGGTSIEQGKRAFSSDSGVGDKELVRILSDVRKKYDVPAMAAALLTSQGLQKVAAVGTRKWGTDVPVTLDDMWHLGSDTKIMTSSLVAILVGQGKLKWTSTVSEVFPELANGFNPEVKDITVLQLLSHVAGLPANIDYASISSALPIRDQRIEAVRIGLRNKPLSAPGQQFLYSNLGYIIVGAMVEKVLNMTWETAITQYIFKPLKMSSAGFGGLGTVGMIDQPWGHEAARTPYSLNGPDADNPPVVGPAGRVHCTIQDWALFVADQLRGARGERAMLKPEDYQMLQNPHFGGVYALGWGVIDRDWAGGKALTHTGSNNWNLAIAWVAPARDFAILVCTNEGQDSHSAADEAVAQIIPIAENH